MRRALAFAAVTLLPVLDRAGFTGPDSPEAALSLLSTLYALIPCALKLIAIALLLATPVTEESP